MKSFLILNDTILIRLHSKSINETKSRANEEESAAD